MNRTSEALPNGALRDGLRLAQELAEAEADPHPRRLRARSTTDLVARLVAAQALRGARPVVVVENKGGAAATSPPCR